MKRSILFTFIAFLALPALSPAAPKSPKPVKVFWDGGTIPDPLFRKYILDNFDTDRDGRISQAEAEAVTEIDVSRTPEEYFSEGFKGVESIEEIMYFINLRKLDCSFNQINHIPLGYYTDIKGNPVGLKSKKKHSRRPLPLEELYCKMTQIQELDLNKVYTELKKLEVLSAGGIDGYPNMFLRSVKIPFDTSLKHIDVSNAHLTRLEQYHGNISGNNLETILCQNNRISELTITNCPKLKKIDCSGNWLKNHTRTRKKRTDGREVEYIPHVFGDLPSLTELNCSNNGLELLEIDNGCEGIEVLRCDSNKLTKLDLSKNPRLRSLSCANNQIEVLDFSSSMGVTEELNCAGNPLTSLKIISLNLKKLIIPEMSLLGISHLWTSFPDTVVYGSQHIQDFKRELKRAEFHARQEKERRETRQRIEERQQAVVKEQQRIEGERLAAEYQKVLAPYIALGDWKEVKSIADRALSNIPGGNAYLYMIAAKAYYHLNLKFDLGDYENAEPYFRAYRNEAYHLLDLCNRSIKLDSSTTNEAYFHRGLAYILTKNPTAAAADFTMAMRGNSAMEAAGNYNIGIAYENSKSYTTAIYYYKLAHSHYTDKKDKSKCLRHIKTCQEELDKQK